MREKERISHENHVHDAATSSCGMSQNNKPERGKVETGTYRSPSGRHVLKCCHSVFTSPDQTNR